MSFSIFYRTCWLVLGLAGIIFGYAAGSDMLDGPSTLVVGIIICGLMGTTYVSGRGIHVRG